MSYNLDYTRLLTEILDTGAMERNERTGSMMKRLQGRKLDVWLGAGTPMLWTRKMRPKTMAAELAWTISGKQTTDWISKYTKIWKKFEDAPGLIENAYGYMWRRRFVRDQLALSLGQLVYDPSSRQNLVVAWHPGAHGLGAKGFKNVPCPFAFQVLVTGGRLGMIVYIRSSDAFLGLPYDVGMYSLLAASMAASAGLHLGTLSIMLGDVHLYQNQWDHAETQVETYIKEHKSGQYLDEAIFEPWKIDQIELDPDGYVKLVEDAFAAFKFADFDPKVEVVL